MTSSLKEAMRDKATRNQAYEVNIIFHEGVDTNSQRLQDDIEEASGCRVGNKFLPNMVRLIVKGLNLQAVASIDDVRHIEEVGMDVEFNNVAREILRLDFPQPTAQTQQHTYEGQGQVIAVADTGLDGGQRQVITAADTGLDGNGN